VLAFDVAGVECGLGLEQHDVRFLVSKRAGLDAMRHDDELAGVD
jgi:hypothetical protein